MHTIVFLLLLLLLPSAAGAQEPVQENTVTVSATGFSRQAPDQAVLLLAVESFAATAQEATRANASKMDALLAALRRLGIGGDKVRTTSYDLHPEYDFRREPEPRQPGEDRLIGYRAVNMVQVTIDDVDRVGAIIDAAVAAGANRVAGLSFQIRDPETARRAAVKEAVAKARAEAETVAQALGRRLGPALAVSTTGFLPPPRPLQVFEAAARMPSVPTPIEPGALEVAATVTATFRLDPAR